MTEYSRGGSNSVLVDGVADWLMSQALGDGNVDEIFDGCCHRLTGAGIPLWRCYVSFRILHPLFASVSLIWRRGEAMGTTEHLHGQVFTTDEWQRSPMHHMMTTRIPYLRRRIAGEDAQLDFDVLEDFRAQGATDYLGFLVPFSSREDEADTDFGIVGSWATDRDGGFSERDIQSLLRIQRRLAVSFKVQIKDQISHDVLSTYLGMDAGNQVLRGQIRRGDGDTVYAVIWYCDLRNSTPMADSMSAAEFLAVLNVYFECTAGAVLAHGGEVLRFIGDAVLAIFPIRDDGMNPEDACAAAVQAAREARKRMHEANRQRTEEGQAPLEFGLGLHVGEVMYGNIGVPERLEFSVVGPAANEVARIETLTKEIGQRTLLSADFARHLDMELVAMGPQALRGGGEPLEVFALPQEAASFDEET